MTQTMNSFRVIEVSGTGPNDVFGYCGSLDEANREAFRGHRQGRVEYAVAAEGGGIAWWRKTSGGLSETNLRVNLELAGETLWVPDAE